jgi:hypothetical protein
MIFKEYFTKSVGPGRLSAEKLKATFRTDRQTDTLIWGGLGNLRFLQVYYSSSSHQFDMSHPHCYKGPTCQLEPFFAMKSKKLPALACPIDAIGASARLMGTFSGFMKATSLLHQAMRAV